MAPKHPTRPTPPSSTPSAGSEGAHTPRPPRPSQSISATQQLRAQLEAELGGGKGERPVLTDPHERAVFLGNVRLRLAGTLSLVAIFIVMLLPGGRSATSLPPWELVLMPGSTNFIAAMMGLLALAIQLRPMTCRGRAVALGIIGWLILVFAGLLTDVAVDGQTWDGQPAISTLVKGGVAPLLLFYMAGLTLPTALYWRHGSADPLGASIALGAGVGLVLFVYFGGQAIGMGDQMPIEAIIASVSDASHAGDRIAAGLALCPLFTAFASLAVLLRRPFARRAAPWLAVAFGAGTILPVLVLALYTAPLAEWALVLEPLKAVLLLGAGLMLLPIAAGAFMSDVDRSPRPVTD